MAKTPSAIELDMLKTQAKAKQTNERKKKATRRSATDESTKPSGMSFARSSVKESETSTSLPIAIPSSPGGGNLRNSSQEKEEQESFAASYCGHPTMFAMEGIEQASYDSADQSNSTLKLESHQSSSPIDILSPPSSILFSERSGSADGVDEDFLQDMLRSENNLLMLREMLNRASENSAPAHPLVGSYTSPRGEYILSSFTPIEHTPAFADIGDNRYEAQGESPELQFPLFSPQS